MNNFFKITHEKDYLKYFIILFAVLLSFNVSNLNVKNILSIIIAIILMKIKYKIVIRKLKKKSNF